MAADPTATDPATTDPPTADLSSATLPTMAQLEDLLRLRQWRQADRFTLDLMLAICDRTAQGWLNLQSLTHFPCAPLHQIDHLWETYSGGQFGLSVQYRLYQQGQSDSLNLAIAVDWVRSQHRPLAFCKFYHQLDFTIDGPKGHLPALWYWQIPWWESLRTGGFGTGRGGGYGDAVRLEALMLRLQRCQSV